MKMKSKILLIAILTSVVFYAHFASSYVPEQTLVFDQVVLEDTAIINTNIKVGIFVKNYFNYTITNITISLNLTDQAPFAINSSILGQITNGNVTLNSTIQSPSELGFTPVNITYGFMTPEYLEYNVTRLEPGKSMIFYYNITSDTIITKAIPFVQMTYYDNWEDLQEIQSQNNILVDFQSDKPDIDTDLPQWGIGNTLSTAWAWVIFALVPAVIAGLSAFLLYFRRR
jgi:hypothetical protein